MSKTTWIIFTVVVVALFGGLIYISSQNAIDVSKVNQNTVQKATEASGNIGDHVYGSDKNKVVLIEYGDYQCPGCGSAYAPIKTVTEKYKNEVTFVFRNNPLTSIHPNAKAAAAAAEAAGKMGKYWEMHNILYEKQDDWSSASISDRGELFSSYASEIGLDENKFSKILEGQGDAINQKINYDLALAKKSGVTGTPTFYLNGKKIDYDVENGKLIASNDDTSSQAVWSDAENFDKLIIQPALKEAGIPLPKTN